MLNAGYWRCRLAPLQLVEWTWGEVDETRLARAGLCRFPITPRWEDLVYPADWPKVRQQLERANRLPINDAPSIDYRIIGAEADLVWVRQTLWKWEVDLDGGRTLLALVQIVSQEKQLERNNLQAAELERKRIGQEIHDDLCQLLAGASALTQRLQDQLRGRVPELAAGVDQINDEIKAGLARTRALAHGLLPTYSSFNTLSQALGHLSQQAATRFNLQLTAVLPEDVPAFPREQLLHLYRIVQEAVSNAFRHGRASAVEVKLASSDAGSVLTIEDNGTGFPPEDQRGQGAGLGCLQNRAELLGGQAEFCNGARGGAVVVLHLPHLAGTVTTTSR